MFAALWALVAMAIARRRLQKQRLVDVRVLRPPSLPATAIRGVLAVLRRRKASCLERSLVLQAWYAAQGAPYEMVIGVSAPGEDFIAHAWLEGEDHCDDGRFEEILRLPAHPYP